MKTKHTLISFTFSLLMVSTALANVDKGLKAYDAREFATALSQWEVFAKQGNASAQSNLGFMYDSGTGVVQNHETAAKWYTLAANQGDAAAQSNLGGMYDVGKGVEENDTTAIKWLTLAAKQGYDHAQTYLGVMYVNGEGVDADYLRAYMWWHISAENGDASAGTYKDSIANKMTPAHLDQAQTMVHRCLNSDYTHC